MSGVGSGEAFRKRFLIAPLVLADDRRALGNHLNHLRANAAIVLNEGPEIATVTTPKFEWDFGDDGGTVEWAREVKWRDSGGTLSGDLTAESGVWRAAAAAAPRRSSGASPTATQTARARGRSAPAATATGRPRRPLGRARLGALDDGCSGDTPGIPVRTRYSFFDGGPQANMVRVERRWTFALQPGATNPAQGMRTYVPASATAPTTRRSIRKPTARTWSPMVSAKRIRTDWNDRWMAINASATNSGVLILRDPANIAPASITRRLRRLLGLEQLGHHPRPAGAAAGWRR